MPTQDTVARFDQEQALPALLDLAPLLGKRISVASESERTAHGFLAILNGLLLGAASGLRVPEPEAVGRELAAIEASSGIAQSQLMRQRIYYSQFQVRGKHTRTLELGRYFRAVGYSGTVPFPLVAQPGDRVQRGRR